MPPRSATWDDLRSTGAYESGRWEIMRHTVRKTDLVLGEGHPALVGMARAAEQRGNRHLYLAMFVGNPRPHLEFRIDGYHGGIVRRHAILKVDGHPLSDMTFDPCNTSVVSDARRWQEIHEETMHLLGVGEVLSVAVTDRVRVGSDREIDDVHDLLIVPLTGFRAAQTRLQHIAHAVRSARV